ncbi:MAG: hypothetical protein Q8R30_02865 [bacterium]|nr:hypothetical protein [bacterium]MDZ4285327.1 hypothetical protein [Candidatus Sungbacteria bacterium]
MCDAWESRDAYERCDLLDNLRGLYDKEVRGEADDTLMRERRQVSARLFVVGARYESGRGFVSNHARCTRES